MRVARLDAGGAQLTDSALGEMLKAFNANGNITCEQDASAPKAQSSIISSNANDGQSSAYGSFEDNGDYITYHKVTQEDEKRKRILNPPHSHGHLMQRRLQV